MTFAYQQGYTSLSCMRLRYLTELYAEVVGHTLSSPACLFRPPGDPHEEVNLFPHTYGAVNWILDKYNFAQVSPVRSSILTSTAGLRCSPCHPE